MLWLAFIGALISIWDSETDVRITYVDTNDMDRKNFQVLNKHHIAIAVVKFQRNLTCFFSRQKLGHNK